MGWGMNTNPKTTRTPAEDNLWYKFILETIELDRRKKNKIKPDGWHWLLSFKSLFNLDIEDIQARLPDEHPLKLLRPSPDDTDMGQQLIRIVGTLKKDLVDAKKNTVIDLSNLTFKNDACFFNFIFPMDVNFKNSEFLQCAYFTNAIFLRPASFENTKFHGKTAKFRATIFHRVADFSNAIFENYANFKVSTFKGRIIFQRAKFKIHAPRFYEAKLNKEIIWNKIHWPRFPNILWNFWQYFLKIIIKKHARSDHINIIKNNQNAYEDLANQMEKLGKYHDHHLFFRNEMGCRRRLENYFTRFFYWSYEKLANYGYGVERAFTAWFLHMCLWAWILFFFIIEDKGTFYERFFCSVLTSASNAHSFLLQEEARKQVVRTEKLHLILVWAFGTIFGAFFLFLFILTLRVRFRLK